MNNKEILETLYTEINSVNEFSYRLFGNKRLIKAMKVDQENLDTEYSNTHNEIDLAFDELDKELNELSNLMNVHLRHLRHEYRNFGTVIDSINSIFYKAKVERKEYHRGINEIVYKNQDHISNQLVFVLSDKMKKIVYGYYRELSPILMDSLEIEGSNIHKG